jgi:hypothetical protein
MTRELKCPNNTAIMRIEMEMDEQGRLPICFMLWELDILKQQTTLAGVFTGRSIAKEYLKYARDCAKMQGREIRFALEEREMNHLFGLSMMQSIGLPLAEEPKWNVR